MIKNITALERQLEILSKPQLIRIVTTIYGMEDHIDDIIDRQRTAGGDVDSSQAVQVLVAQIEKLRSGNEFINYAASSGFADRLESLLGDVEELLGESDPGAALAILELFLTLPEPLYQRIDDSSGSLGGVFKFAVQLWLRFAEQVRAGNPDGGPWVEKILNYFGNDGYGVFDDLISESGRLLTDQELRQLASRFEKEAMKELNGGNHGNDSYKLRQELRVLFQQQPSLHNLEACWPHTDAEGRVELRAEIEALPQPPANLYHGVKMLILVDSIDAAAQLLVRHADQLEVYHYSALTTWTEIFSKSGHLLAQVVCYRYLLDELLDRGYTKAYRHGVQYFHRLLALDETLEDYEGLIDAQAYIHKLLAVHGRKYSFWKAANYPTK